MGADTDSFLTIPEQINNHVDHILKISYTKHNNDLLALKAMNKEISKIMTEKALVDDFPRNLLMKLHKISPLRSVGANIAASRQIVV